jgi:ubiquinone/menaquinone biosynthesis C-methylase UbiE
VLDVGCGTGTLAIRLAERGPVVDVWGIDRDPAMLDRARRKAARRDAGIDWQRAWSTALPFPDRRFDRVFSSLLLHHLPPREKHRTVEEMRRVLRPGGLLLLADWNRTAHPLERAAYFLAVQLLDGLETTAGHVDDLLPRLLREAGMEEVRREGRFTTLAGPLEIWRGRRPGPPTGASSPP